MNWIWQLFKYSDWCRCCYRGAEHRLHTDHSTPWTPCSLWAATSFSSKAARPHPTTSAASRGPEDYHRALTHHSHTAEANISLQVTTLVWSLIQWRGKWLRPTLNDWTIFSHTPTLEVSLSAVFNMVPWGRTWHSSVEYNVVNYCGWLGRRCYERGYETHAYSRLWHVHALLHHCHIFIHATWNKLLLLTHLHS